MKAKTKKQLRAENTELLHRIDEVLNEMQYANAWKRLCWLLELPYASHVETVLSTERPNTGMKTDAAGVPAGEDEGDSRRGG